MHARLDVYLPNYRQVSDDEFQNRKRYGCMRDSMSYRRRRNATKFELLESDLEKPAVRLRYPKNLSVEFHKNLEFVELARSFRFGKCFAQAASLRPLENIFHSLERRFYITRRGEKQYPKEIFLPIKKSPAHDGRQFVTELFARPDRCKNFRRGQLLRACRTQRLRRLCRRRRVPNR